VITLYKKYPFIYYYKNKGVFIEEQTNETQETKQDVVYNVVDFSNIKDLKSRGLCATVRVFSDKGENISRTAAKILHLEHCNVYDLAFSKDYKRDLGQEAKTMIHVIRSSVVPDETLKTSKK